VTFRFIARPESAVFRFFRPGKLAGAHETKDRISREGTSSAVLVKEREVPPREIEEAIRRRRKFELDPERHTYTEG
jgi:hypothetical protein